jgi:ABC-type multidrug transport system fused ATPase/permease subunit
VNRFKSRIKGSVLYRAAAVLSSSDRKKVFAVILIQVFLGGLDLVGVGLIGVIGSLTISGVGAKQPGNRVQWLLDQLQLGDFELQTQATILALLAVFIMVIKTLLSMFFIRKILYFLSYRGAKLSSILVSRLLAQPLLTVQSRSNQETLFALTSGVGSITIGVLATFVSLISDTSLLLVMAIGLFVIDPLLSVTTFTLFTSIAFLLYRVMQVKARTLGEKNRQTNVDSNALILEVLTSYRELVVKNRRFYYSEKIGEQRHKLAGATAELSFMPNISKYVFEIAIVVGSLLISAIQFITNDAARAVATLSIFFAASTRIAPAVLRVQQSSLTIRANTGVAAPTLDLIDFLGVCEIDSDESTKLDFEHKGFVSVVELKNVSLTYPGKNEKAIDRLSLSIKPGEVVALVGPSGAGKTSIIDLMLGIIEPDEGSVTINDLEPLDAISAWPGAIGYMPQDVMISNGTVRENVMLGYSPDKEFEAQVLSALKVAQLIDFVNELPDQLEQQMGDRGTRISGGQRQRLGIARAVFTAPKLLVLDEATSALDGETEANISDAIQKFGDGVTVIMIAHRLSTVLAADRVVYMDKGRVVAQGTFEEVRKSVPDFDRQANLMGLKS